MLKDIVNFFPRYILERANFIAQIIFLSVCGYFFLITNFSPESDLATNGIILMFQCMMIILPFVFYARGHEVMSVFVGAAVLYNLAENRFPFIW